jgi:hypothetical protein
MKTLLTLLMVLITSTALSQKDRVDIYKVKKQIVKSYTTKSYNVTEMYLALRFEGGTNELEEVQIIHKVLNKTEKYYVTSSKRNTENSGYGQIYYTIKNVSDKKYSIMTVNVNSKDKVVSIIPKKTNKSYTYKLNKYRTIYK